MKDLEFAIIEDESMHFKKKLSELNKKPRRTYRVGKYDLTDDFYNMICIKPRSVLKPMLGVSYRTISTIRYNGYITYTVLKKILANTEYTKEQITKGLIDYD